MKTYLVNEIDWDTDGEMISELPTCVELQFTDEEEVEDFDIADELSDRYGFCVNSFNYQQK